jgi:hypothetical protein
MESLHSPITIHEWFLPRKGAFQTTHLPNFGGLETAALGLWTVALEIQGGAI